MYSLPGHFIYNVLTINTMLVFHQEDLWGPAKSAESYWMLADGELNINIQKMNKAEVWDAALMGRGGEEVDAYTKEEQKKKILLERFQSEVSAIYDHAGHFITMLYIKCHILMSVV